MPFMLGSYLRLRIMLGAQICCVVLEAGRLPNYCFNCYNISSAWPMYLLATPCLFLLLVLGRFSSPRGSLNRGQFERKSYRPQYFVMFLNRQ